MATSSFTEAAMVAGFQTVLGIPPHGSGRLAGTCQLLALAYDVAASRCSGRDVAIDSAGDVVARGEVSAPSGPYQFTVAKLANADGAQQWMTTVVGSNPFRSGGRAKGIAIDANDDIIAVGGTFNGSGTFDVGDLTVAKLSGATGAEVWRVDVPGPAVTSFSGMFVQALAVAIDPLTQEIVVAGGKYSGDPGSYDGNSKLVVLRLSSTGSQLWLDEISGTATGAGSLNSRNAAQE